MLLTTYDSWVLHQVSGLILVPFCRKSQVDLISLPENENHRKSHNIIDMYEYVMCMISM
jgi:hypothetical protein